MPAFAAWAATATPPAELLATPQVDCAAPGQRLFSEINSELRFSVSIIGLLRKAGDFQRFCGVLTRDSDAEQVRVSLQIDSGSARMKLARDTRHVLSSEFFASEKFPRITFQSEPVDANILHDASGQHVVKGVLFLRGQAHSETLFLQVRDCAVGQALARCAFTVEGEISRRRYGMRSHRAFVSDGVVFSVRIGPLVAPSGAQSDARTAN